MSNKKAKKEYSTPRRGRTDDEGRDHQIIKHECNNQKNSESPLINGKAKTETESDQNHKLDKERKYKIHDTATRQCLILR